MMLRQDGKLTLLMTMRKKRIRQRELAEHLKISCSAISQWFNNKSTLCATNEQKIIKYVDSK